MIGDWIGRFTLLMVGLALGAGAWWCLQTCVAALQSDHEYAAGWWFFGGLGVLLAVPAIATLLAAFVPARFWDRFVQPPITGDNEELGDIHHEHYGPFRYFLRLWTWSWLRGWW